MIASWILLVRIIPSTSLLLLSMPIFVRKFSRLLTHFISYYYFGSCHCWCYFFHCISVVALTFTHINGIFAFVKQSGLMCITFVILYVFKHVSMETFFHLQIPGVPAIYALRTALFLESPSAAQRQFVKTSEEQRLHMTDLEYEMLTKGTKNMSTTHQEKDRSDEDGFGDQNLEVQAVAKKHTARKGLGVKDKVQFKRKKAKVLPISFIFLYIYYILFFLSFYMSSYS